MKKISSLAHLFTFCDYILHSMVCLYAAICKSFLCAEHVEGIPQLSTVLGGSSTVLRCFASVLLTAFYNEKGMIIHMVREREWCVVGHCLKRWTYTLLWLDLTNDGRSFVFFISPHCIKWTSRARQVENDMCWLGMEWMNV